MDSEVRSYRTGGAEVVLDLTRDVADFVAGRGDGLLHVFVPHATAGLAILETGAGSDDDLLAALGDLLPADDRWRHRHGSAGARPVARDAGARAAVLLACPCSAALLALGTWQSICLVDLNVDNADREVRFSFLPKADPGLTSNVCSTDHGECPSTSRHPDGRAKSGRRTRRTGRPRPSTGCSTCAPPNTAATPGCDGTSSCWRASRCCTSRPSRQPAVAGLSQIRSDLKDVATLEVVEAAVMTFQLDEARLLATRRAVGLVEDALRGRRYVARL